MSVIIGIPSVGLVYDEFFLSMLGMFHHDSCHERYISGFIRQRSSILAYGRNRLAEDFLIQYPDAEWLCMVDTDMMFPPDTLARLMAVASPERPIWAGLCFGYQEKTLCVPVFYKIIGEDYMPIAIEPNHMYKLDAAGTGFMLIHRSVLVKLGESTAPWPWFGHDLSEVNPKKMLGEDITFCQRARAAGFEIWGHGGVEIDHIKTHRLGMPDYLARKEGH